MRAMLTAGIFSPFMILFPADVALAVPSVSRAIVSSGIDLGIGNLELVL
jgi:hypothetical protein